MGGFFLYFYVQGTYCDANRTPKSECEGQLSELTSNTLDRIKTDITTDEDTGVLTAFKVPTAVEL